MHTMKHVWAKPIAGVATALPCACLVWSITPAMTPRAFKCEHMIREKAKIHTEYAPECSPNVLHDAVTEKRSVLRHHCQRTTQRVKLCLAHIHAIHQHLQRECNKHAA